MARTTSFRSSLLALAPAPRAHARRGSLHDCPIIDARHLLSIPGGRPRIGRGTDHIIGRERLAHQALGVAEHTVEASDRGIGERGGHDLTSRQHEVTERDGLGGEIDPHPLVCPTVTSTDYGKVGPSGDLVHIALRKPASGRLREHDPPLLSHLPRRNSVDVLECPGHDVDPYDHPGATPVGHIIDAPVRRIVTKIEATVANIAVLYGPANDPDSNRGVDRCGEDAEDVYLLHGTTPRVVEW